MRIGDLDVEQTLAALERRAEIAEARAARAEARCVETERRWLTDDRFDMATEIIAGFVHEARSPLGALVCNLGVLGELLPATALPADSELAAVIDDSRTACRAIEHALTRLRACGDGTGQPCLTPLPVLIDSVGVLFRRHMTRRGVRLTVDIEGEPSVWGTPGGICRILFGLLAHATDASPRGATIRVAVRSTEERVVVFVRGEGPALDVENAERLFSPLDQTTGPDSGIRLAVARSLAAQHGGWLSFEAVPPGDLGSCVRLDLRSSRPAGRTQ